MSRHKLVLLAIGPAFLSSRRVLRAHHAEAAEYDATISTAPPGALMRRGVTTLRPDWDKLGLLEYVCAENNRCPGGQCRESSA